MYTARKYTSHYIVVRMTSYSPNTSGNAVLVVAFTLRCRFGLLAFRLRFPSCLAADNASRIIFRVGVAHNLKHTHNIILLNLLYHIKMFTYFIDPPFHRCTGYPDTLLYMWQCENVAAAYCLLLLLTVPRYSSY